MLLFGACQNDKTAQPNPVPVGSQATYLRFDTPEDFKKALMETSKMSRKELDDWDKSKGFVSLRSIYEQIVDEENEAFDAEEKMIQKNPMLVKTLKHKNSSKINNVKDLVKVDNSGIELNLYDADHANLLNKDGVVKIGKSLVRYGTNYIKVVLDGDYSQVPKLSTINEQNQTANLRYFPVRITSKEVIPNGRPMNNNRYCWDKNDDNNYEMQAWSDGYYEWYYIVGYEITTVSTAVAKIEMKLRRKGWTGQWTNHNTTSYGVDGTWGFTHNLEPYWPSLPSSPHGPNTITLGSGFDGHTSNPKYYFYYAQAYNLNTAWDRTLDMTGTQNFSSLDCSCTNSF
jgi:hypothetical protein